MFIVHGVVFHLHGSVFFLIEGFIVFLAMILIGRLVERKKREAEERAYQGRTEDPNLRG